MTNRWIEFVRRWAAKADISYACAISKPECRAEYQAKYGNRKKLPRKTEREMMGAEDIRSRAVENKTKQVSKDRLGMLQEDIISQLARKADKTKELRGKMVKELKEKQEEKKRNIEMSRMMGEDRNIAKKKKKKPLLIIEDSDEEEYTPPKKKPTTDEEQLIKSFKKRVNKLDVPKTRLVIDKLLKEFSVTDSKINRMLLIAKSRDHTKYKFKNGLGSIIENNKKYKFEEIQTIPQEEVDKFIQLLDKLLPKSKK
jgi:hypothetical protein